MHNCTLHGKWFYISLDRNKAVYLRRHVEIIRRQRKFGRLSCTLYVSVVSLLRFEKLSCTFSHFLTTSNKNFDTNLLYFAVLNFFVLQNLAVVIDMFRIVMSNIELV